MALTCWDLPCLLMPWYDCKSSWECLSILRATCSSGLVSAEGCYFEPQESGDPGVLKLDCQQGGWPCFSFLSWEWISGLPFSMLVLSTSENVAVNLNLGKVVDSNLEDFAATQFKNAVSGLGPAKSPVVPALPLRAHFLFLGEFLFVLNLVLMFTTTSSSLSLHCQGHWQLFHFLLVP